MTKYFMNIYKEVTMKDYMHPDNRTGEYHTLDMVGSHEDILGRVTTNPRQEFKEFLSGRDNKHLYIYTLREIEEEQ